ncbi:ATPase, P-type (transporting), HAD superfamily, subfamily IC [Desulfofundulus australicus DSM 11792]|uniref:ATPase, P-type (Transporting), HAD superfamily, subfamily IC n=1 Tax=Desulfofundulus australicus DSM 11792 TaxID=1121425 RepID=A0A1M5D6L0_9FIRM|nr:MULTISPECIES: HAD hydrolase family protein [Desulfofundulus]MBE3585059.1 HAD hydrolase family protein [Thermoanaerobacter sp.]SHF62669.1 ATPase, P-type (transporting), HAD superfamily, subfamily IC [Desulfofundulus australicus DSM 11792]
MLTIDIPERETLKLKYLVLDFNGTLAKDGNLLSGVEERLNALSEKLEIHILTADTFGTGEKACRNIKGHVQVLKQGKGVNQKLKFIERLGLQNTVAVGNGTNDTLMLKNAALGIAVLGPEGASVQALLAADVVVKDICEGLDLLLHPVRLIATLRL